tara:strand:- start:2702 stop:3778 length:1077 start_codon:yes stop_codon:yes gene_type:complete
MIGYILLGLIFTSIFTIKSLLFNYAFSSSFNFIYQLELIALLSYNSKYVGIKECMDCFNIFTEWILLGWIGLPFENETVKNVIPDDNFVMDSMKIIILVSWLISFIITLIIKVIHYYCRFGKVYCSNINKVILKFFLSNYTSMLLWSLVSFIKENSFQIIKFWFELSNLLLFIFLSFVMKSIIIYILYGKKRIFYKSIYKFIHYRFKSNFKLWMIFNLVMKDLLVIPVSIMIMNKSFSYNYLIVNYILVLYLIIYTVVNALIDPFKVTTRKDFIVTNIINFISLFFVLFNELSLYVDNDYIYGLWVVKTIIISILLLFIFMVSIRNYCIEKKHRDNYKKIDDIEMIEISLPTSQDIDV